MYNFNHLYYFYITAKSGGVTAASRHLYLSQPSLSSQLKVLESALGLKLFEKKGRCLELTDIGRVVYRYCQPMFEISEKMATELREIETIEKRSITIGLSYEVDRSFIIKVINNFLSHYKKVLRPKLIICAGDCSDLSDRLRFGEVDVVISDDPLNGEGFTQISKCDIPVVLCASKEWKPEIDEIDLEDPSALRTLVEKGNVMWLTPTQKSKLRRDFENFCAKNAIPMRLSLESDFIYTLVYGLRENTGLSMLPIAYLIDEIELNTLKIIGPKSGFWKHEFLLTGHKNSPNNSIVNSLKNAFEKVSQDFK